MTWEEVIWVTWNIFKEVSICIAQKNDYEAVCINLKRLSSSLYTIYKTKEYDKSSQRDAVFDLPLNTPTWVLWEIESTTRMY